MLRNVGKFGGLKVTAVLLFVIAASQVSKFGRAKAAKAESNLKTHTWKYVEDYNPEIFLEENYDKSDDDFLNLFQKKRGSCSSAENCRMLNNTCFNTIEAREAACKSGGCSCRPNNGRNLLRCDECFYTGN